MQPTIVKAKQAHDFLALVPQLVGFLPEQSTVLVAFRGNRTCGAMRFNLPDTLASQTVHKRIATTLVGTLCKIPGVDALVPVVYTNERFCDVVGMPHERFLQALVKRAELSGFLVRDALCVGADGWGSYLDPECPAEGRPLEDIAASSVHQAIPPESRAALGTLLSGGELPPVERGAKEHFCRVYRRYERLERDPRSHPELVDLIGGVLDPVETAELALEWNPDKLDMEAAAALLFLVQGPMNRDQIMLQVAFGKAVGIQTYEVNLRYAAIARATGLSMDEIVTAERVSSGGCDTTGVPSSGGPADGDPGGTGAPSAQETADRMIGTSVERPDPERVLRAIELLKVIVAMAPRSARPAPLCMLAWLSWALGRASVAGIFIDQALMLDAHYSMATLLRALVDSGHLPEWAFAVPLHDRP